MEKYIEIAVPKKNTVKDYGICFACCLLPMLVGTYLVLMIFSVTSGNVSITGLACVVCAGLYYLSYKIFLRFYIDWEYILVGDEIRFSKIINKSKRRDIITLMLSKVEVVAKISDKEHIGAIAKAEKKYSFISQTTDDYYFMIAFTDSGTRVCIFFEPDERMLDNFKTTLRGKVF